MAFTYAGLINTQTWFDQFGKLLKNTALTLTAHNSMTLWNIYGGASRAPVVTQPISTDAEGNFAHGDLYGDPGDIDVYRGSLYLGTFHIAPDIREFSGAAGPPGPTLNPRGTYSGATTYAAYDQVNWSASGPQGSYYAKAAPPVGTDPSNTTYWAKIADPGATGATGPPTVNWVSPTTIQPSTTYNVNDGLQDAGGSWRCILSYTTGLSPTVPSLDATHWVSVATQGAQGAAGVNWRSPSTIQGSTAYALNDGLQGSDGGSYRCILAYTSAASPVDPSADATHWAYVALRGNPGATGAAGLNWRSPSTIQASTAYALNDALQDAGGSWRCILAFTTGVSPTPPSQDATHWAFVATQGTQGTPGVGINWRSPLTIQPSTAYSINDGLQDAGGTWRCILAYTTGPSPTVPSLDATHWAYVATQGPAGAAGNAAPTGAAGGTDIGGTYPSALTVVNGAITDAKVAASAAIQESKLSLASDGIVSVPTRRTLGTGPQQAAPGNAAGIILAGVYYNPPNQVYSITANPAAANALPVDSTNLKVTFTVPASGKVWVELEIPCISANPGALYWTVMNGTAAGSNVSGATTGPTVGAVVQNDAIYKSRRRRFLVDGLTAAAVLTWYWGAFVDAAGHTGGMAPEQAASFGGGSMLVIGG